MTLPAPTYDLVVLLDPQAEEPIAREADRRHARGDRGAGRAAAPRRVGRARAGLPDRQKGQRDLPPVPVPHRRRASCSTASTARCGSPTRCCASASSSWRRECRPRRTCRAAPPHAAARATCRHLPPPHRPRRRAAAPAPSAPAPAERAGRRGERARAERARRERPPRARRRRERTCCAERRGRASGRGQRRRAFLTARRSRAGFVPARTKIAAWVGPKT